MIVHQVLSGAGPVDAVTTQALRWRERFTQWGWQGRDVAVHIDPRVDGAIKPLKQLHATPQDLLLIHYSAYAPKLRALLDLPNRKVLLSHNVTPAKWFWDYEPTIAIHCALGRRQLPEFAERCDLVAGVSAYNAEELGSADVVPILFDPHRLGEPQTPPPGPPTLLFVGRLAPHKRQDELIKLTALLRENGVPDVRLHLIGEPLNPHYRQRLEDLARQVAPGAVTFESGLSTTDLADRYRQAHAFVSLSEHEGFCIPLLEAFHMRVPVIARPSGGVPEVAGDAALLTADDLPTVAELTKLALDDGELRGELIQRGTRRLEDYEPRRTEAKMRDLLTRAART